MAKRKTPSSHQTVNEIEAHFRRPAVREKIGYAADSSKQWLERCAQSYDENGNLQAGKPWWDTTIQPTSNKILLRERPRVYEDRIVGHGMLEMFNTLLYGTDSALYKELLGCNPWEVAVAHVTDPITWVIIRELIRLEEAYKEGMSKLPSMQLNELSKLYGYSSSTSPVKMRNRLVNGLAPLGLVGAYVNGTYSIFAGIVASNFYHKVFFPMVEQYEEPQLVRSKTEPLHPRGLLS